MREGSSATPLIALDAIVIDTETTALDPRKARLIEFAGAPLVAGAIEPSRSFRALVNPGEPIPVEATRVHGIDDKAVANAPDFKTAWPDITNALGKSIVIGHTLGFDLAVLKRECERANLQWRRPRMLDTRLLAQAAEPNLAGFSLESLAAWLGVKTENRHSALGDAIMTAHIFIALVPKLRARGIRTLGEAENACRALIDVLDDQHRAGWIEAIEAPRRAEGEKMLFRIDTQPFRHRVSEVMSKAQFAPHGTHLRDIVRRLSEQRMSSVFVSHASANPDRPRPETAGIVTERDVLWALADHGASALDMPVEHFAMHPLASVPSDAFVYRALGRMNRLQIRHLGVTDAQGIVVGALSARDLLQSRAEEAIWLGDEIDQAVNAKGLAAAWSRLPLVAEGLLSEDMAGRDIAGIVSRELGALTRRAGVLAEQSMRKEGDGEPPCAYALALLGSGGRDESLLALDQDNALIFEAGVPGGAADRWFAKFGTIVADILHEAGVPYCKGGVMAKNAKWRGSLLTWRDRIADWIRRSKPDDLLSVDIFFDLRGVHGEPSLAAGLRADAFMLAAGEVEFAKLLAESAGTTDAALTFLGGIKTVNGRIDLKKSGLFGIVTMARVLAIRHNLTERTTPARLSAIKALGIGGNTDLDRLDAAQATFLDLILKQQIRDIQIGLPPNNAVAVKELSRGDRELLLDALKAVRHLDDLTKELLFGG